MRKDSIDCEENLRTADCCDSFAVNLRILAAAAVVAVVFLPAVIDAHFVEFASVGRVVCVALAIANIFVVPADSEEPEAQSRHCRHRRLVVLLRVALLQRFAVRCIGQGFANRLDFRIVAVVHFAPECTRCCC